MAAKSFMTFRLIKILIQLRYVVGGLLAQSVERWMLDLRLKGLILGVCAASFLSLALGFDSQRLCCFSPWKDNLPQFPHSTHG